MDIKQANVAPMLATQIVTAIVAGTAVDLRRFDYAGQVVLSATVGTAGVLDVLFEEADDPAGPWDPSTFAPFDQITDTDFVQMVEITPSQYRRYMRPSAQWASGAFTVSVNLVAPYKQGRAASQRVDT